MTTPNRTESQGHRYTTALPFMLATMAILNVAAIRPAHASPGGTYYLTMDPSDHSATYLDGLSITKEDFTFSFSEPGRQLTYGYPWAYISTQFIQGFAVVGVPDAFTVLFSEPVSFVSFGIATLNFAPATTDFLFELTEAPSVPFKLTNQWSTGPSSSGEEARFTWSGDPITSFTLLTPPGASLLGFDNLTVIAADVPEPPAWSMMAGALGITGLLLRSRYRRRQSGELIPVGDHSC